MCCIYAQYTNNYDRIVLLTNTHGALLYKQTRLITSDPTCVTAPSITNSCIDLCYICLQSGIHKHSYKYLYIMEFHDHEISHCLS